MIDSEILKELSSIVGTTHFLSKKEDLENYASDATKVSHMPDAVAFPANTEQISRILQMATRGGFPVIPRGGGSGMSGGAVPIHGGLVLAMDRFNRILRIDQDNLVAEVEPAVITADFQRAVEALDLLYPPDPASSDISTIGGNVAECAGGLRAVKYGVTRDYVLGLTVVLPTGEILHTGVETMKGVAGYDLTRLIIGSEGTLAVITAITLRLLPRPESKKTMLAFFPDASSAVNAVTSIIKAKVVPSILEFMDRHCISCVREEMNRPIPSDAEAMLLIEVDGDEVLLEKDAERVQTICKKGRAVGFESASNGEEAMRLWDARRKVSPSLYKLRPHKISEDVVVPRSRMAELVNFLDKMGQKYHLPIPAFGHAGDGNLHVNIMLDKTRDTEIKNADELVAVILKAVIKMGGTITGEHGIGITKAPYLAWEIPRAGLELMSRIKKAFDPKGILNPGKIIV